MSSGKRGRAGACSVCRVRKRRCLPGVGGPQAPCQMCAVLSVPCSLIYRDKDNFAAPIPFRTNEHTSSPGSAITDNPSVSPSSETAPSQMLAHAEALVMPPPHVLRDLVDLYFRLIHNGPHTLFHEPTFLVELGSNKLSPVLLLSVISISARFSREEYFYDVDPRLRGRPFAEAAMNILQQDMIKPSLITIQGCLLMSQYLGGGGDVKSKHIYIGLARLHSQAIRLWEMPIESTIIMREVCRRTWLSVVIADKWSAADMSTSSGMAETRDVFPILDEVEFVSLRPDSNEISVHFQSSGHGIWTQMAKTIEIFRSISDMILGLGSGRRSIASQQDLIVNLGLQLENWVNDLPYSLVFNMQNLTQFSNVGFGKTFLAMHIGYHHFRQLLYYAFLDDRQVGNGHLANSYYSRLCKEHAVSVSEIAKLAFQNRDCELVYYIIGHILVVSSSVHLHTLLLSDNISEADQARRHLISNFEILMQLKMFWPIIDNSVGRLRTFQNDCRSSLSDSFVLDGWMLKFLMEHSAVLDLERWSVRRSQTTYGQSLLSKQTNEFGTEDGLGFGSLSALVSDQNLSNDALVENALSWLLD